MGRVAGQNPARIVADFGKKAPLLHVKDGPGIHGQKGYGQVPSGDGLVDFPAVVKTGGRNTRWIIVEIDEYDKSIFDGIGRSYSYLTKHGLAKGKV